MGKKKSQRGIALIWVIIAGLLLITGIQVAFVSQAKKQAQKTEEGRTDQAEEASPQPGEIKKGEGEEGEEFVAKIEEIIAKGTPTKCTYTQEGFQGTSYIKGKKMFSEIRVEGGATTYTIIKDNCLWSWGWEENQGTKICFEEDIWKTSEVPADVDHRCIPIVFADSQFVPPANIDFTEAGELTPELSRDERLLKILPPKERTELESAIKEAQDVLKDIQPFNPSDIINPDTMFKGFDEIKRQANEEVQKRIETYQQQ